MDRIEILNMLNYYTILNELTLPSPGSKSTDLIPGLNFIRKYNIAKNVLSTVDQSKMYKIVLFQIVHKNDSRSLPIKVSALP